MALSSEDQAWRDAYYIAWAGASNPVAVERAELETEVRVGAGHQAVLAMAGHLDYLRGKSLGPEVEDLRAVRANARRLGMIDDGGNYIGDARG